MAIALPFRGRPHPPEQRAAPRYRCPPATLVLVCRPGTEGHLEGWAHELSRSGIGLNLAEPLDVGSAAVVRIHARKPCGTLLLAAQVKHATAQADGSWRVGCAFDEPLDVDLMDALL